MRISLTTEVKYLLEKLHNAGYGAWIVGGCVRDSIIGREINDWDVCTTATPDMMEEALSGERIIRTGIKHGTLTVLINRMPIEVTTTRADGYYADHRRPESVSFVDDLAKDLSRRDFTINSMAYSEELGLIDPNSGLEDIKRFVIRSVGDARERFSQDALRILRAVRFSSQLDFYIEPETANAAVLMRGDLSFVSRQRVYVELKKLLGGRAGLRAVRENKQVICAALEVGDVNLDFCRLAKDAAVSFVLMLGNDAYNAVKALKTDGDTLSRVQSLCAALDYPPVQSEREALSLLHDVKSTRTALDLVEVWRCRGIEIDEGFIREALVKCHSIRQLAINGNDLIDLGFRGREVGTALNELLTDVINGEAENERESLIRKASKAIDITRKM